jgi:hypothetical protein
MNYEDIKKGTFKDIIKGSLANFSFLEDLLIVKGHSNEADFLGFLQK